VRPPLFLCLVALSILSCKPKAPPTKVTFADVCSTAFDPKHGVAPDVVLEGYLAIPRVSTACSRTCLLDLTENPGNTGHRISAFVKIGSDPSTMDALGATYKLTDLKIRDASGTVLDPKKRVRLTGWRAGLGGMGCGINPSLIEAAE
jgi:hypothetical protein